MHLFPFYFTNWHYPQDNWWLYYFIVVLESNNETNFHFIFVWTIELKIIEKLQNFLVRNCPTKFVIYLSSTFLITQPQAACHQGPAPQALQPHPGSQDLGVSGEGLGQGALRPPQGLPPAPGQAGGGRPGHRRGAVPGPEAVQELRGAAAQEVHPGPAGAQKGSPRTRGHEAICKKRCVCVWY